MMRREIGGYLELERLGSGRPYREGGIALDSARSCLAYLIELRGIRRLLIPDYMCDAVRLTCEACGTEVEVYQIGSDFAPCWNFNVDHGGWLYLADYFGQLTEEDVNQALAISKGRLIIDEVQGFYRDPWPNIDTLYTCRKFFGVADGAYLFTSDGKRLKRDLPRGKSADRMAHVLGRLEGTASQHYVEYKKAEEGLPYGRPVLMSQVTERLLKAVDYKKARTIREENFRALSDILGPLNMIEVRPTPGPYMYPLLLKDALGMREECASDGIYVPTLWPNVLDECPNDSVASRYARDILPLPVDQRYGAEDMERLAGTLIPLIRGRNR